MSRVPVVAVLVLASGLAGCKRSAPISDSVTRQDAGVVELPSEMARRNRERTVVSPIELLARPKEYSGRSVRTDGYLRMRDEDQMLYISEEFARHGLASSSIAIHPGHCGSTEEDPEVLTKLRSFAERYVSITGKFVVGDPNVLTFQVGSLCDISAVSPIPTIDPEPPRTVQ
jgi:hypothetical protein